MRHWFGSLGTDAGVLGRGRRPIGAGDEVWPSFTRSPSPRGWKAVSIAFWRGPDRIPRRARRAFQRNGLERKGKTTWRTRWDSPHFFTRQVYIIHLIRTYGRS